MWTCAHCGDQADPESAPDVALSWTTSIEGGTLQRYCPTCSRTHLRSIEGKLDEAHW